MPSVPSVTMKGSMRPRVISRPCARPNSGAEQQREAPCRSATVGQRRPAARRQRVHQQDHAAGDQRRHRADRQVDAAGDDDEAHADRDDADEGGAGEHVHRVVDGGEVAVEQRAGDAQQHQADDRAEAVQRGPSAPAQSARCGGAGVSVRAGGMGDQLLFGELSRRQRRPAAGRRASPRRGGTGRSAPSAPTRSRPRPQPCGGQLAGSGSRCRAWRRRRRRGSARRARPRAARAAAPWPARASAGCRPTATTPRSVERAGADAEVGDRRASAPRCSLRRAAATAARSAPGPSASGSRPGRSRRAGPCPCGLRSGR